MKFLCLHGKGTSANIFKSQTASFRYKLPHEHDFEFVNAGYSSGPAAGIQAFYSAPYYAWWTGTAVEEIRASHEWLTEYIRKNGPYDGLMGFSQGCSLISSYILFHTLEKPNTPLPFKVAIFICGGLPLNVVPSLGMEVSGEAEEWDNRSRIMLQQRASLLDYDVRRGIDPWYVSPPDSSPSSENDDDSDPDLYFRQHHPTHPASAFNDFGRMNIHPDTLDHTDVFGLNFDQLPSHLKIKIPTVHVYGNKDPRYPSGIQLTQFCEPGLRMCYDHKGGHEIPRGKKVSERIAELVEWAAAMAGAMKVDEIAKPTPAVTVTDVTVAAEALSI